MLAGVNSIPAASFLFLEIDMSEAKFTKGEWVVYGGDLRYCKGKVCIIESDDMPTVIADLNDYFGKESRDANAHLIAAAPSMYAMLEEVAKELYNLIDEVNDQRLSHVHASSSTQPDLCDGETIHNIQLLLAKARGE